MHAKWMGYKEISSGTIGGWMTHFINTVHYVTECDFPTSAAAWGGKYAFNNDPKCTAPDQTMVILEYPEGFHTQFTSHFGNTIDDETTIFMFERGSIRTKFGHALGNPLVSSEGSKDEIKPYKLLDTEPGSAAEAHIKNWFDCIRNGGLPNANVDFGYKQGVTVAMGDLAWETGCKVTYDKQKREVRKA
jgi:predicted dehydrogenase